MAPFIVAGSLLALALRPGAQRAGARRRRGQGARPARRPRPRGQRRWRSSCCAGRRRRRPGRSPSSGSSSRTSRGSSPVPTTAGSCRTRWCSPRSCCWAADIVGRVVIRPERAAGGHRHRRDRRAVLRLARAPAQPGGAVSHGRPCRTPPPERCADADARRVVARARVQGRPRLAAVTAALARRDVRRHLRVGQRRRLPDPALRRRPGDVRARARRRDVHRPGAAPAARDLRAARRRGASASRARSSSRWRATSWPART